MKKNSQKRSLVGVVAAVSILALGACSSGGTSAGQGGDQSSGQQIETVGLLLQDVSNPFFATMKNAVEELGADEGFKVNTQDAQQDVGTQSNQIDVLVQQQVDVILLNSVDTDGVGPAVQRALDAGIVVVGVDVDAANAQAVVSTDNIEAGRQACRGLAEKIGGTGNLLVINGTQVTSVQERVAGCYDVLEGEYPDIKVVGDQAGRNDVASGQQITTDLLTANPNVQGIFGINDPTARGAVLALQQAGRGGVWVTGVDGSPEAVTEMTVAGSSFWGTAAQDPGRMATRAFELAKEILEGSTPAERIELIKPEFVDQDNVADYPGWDVG